MGDVVTEAGEWDACFFLPLGPLASALATGAGSGFEFSLSLTFTNKAKLLSLAMESEISQSGGKDAAGVRGDESSAAFFFFFPPLRLPPVTPLLEAADFGRLQPCNKPGNSMLMWGQLRSLMLNAKIKKQTPFCR
jgi:hypothetical protein